MLYCMQQFPEEGGGMCVVVGESGTLSITDCVLKNCQASTANMSVGETGGGRGGWLYLQSSGYNPDTPLGFWFADLSFANNSATVGRDLFVVCPSLSNQLNESLFDIDLTPAVFNRSNAFYGSSSLVQNETDTDLLKFMEIYQADTIFVSSLQGSSTEKTCGSRTLPCSSLTLAVSHLVEGFEKRIFVDGMITLHTSISVWNTTFKASAKNAAILVGSQHTDAAQGKGVGSEEAGVKKPEAPIVCSGRSAFQKLTFIFVSAPATPSNSFIISDGDLELSSCLFTQRDDLAWPQLGLFNSLSFPHFPSSSSSSSSFTYSAQLPFTIISCASGSVDVSNCTFSGLSWINNSAIEVVVDKTEQTQMSLLITSSSFSSLTRSSIGPTALTTSSESLSIRLERLNCSLCSSPTLTGSVLSFHSSSSVALRDCVLEGQPASTDSFEEGLCTWSGSLLHCEQCVATLELTTFANSSKGALTVSGGKLSVSQGEFCNNTPEFHQYPSARRNIACISPSTKDGTSLLIISSLKGGDGSKDNSSLWISSQTNSCTLAGLAAERPSAFFVPSLHNVTLYSDKAQYLIDLHGSLLLPCATKGGVVSLDEGGTEKSLRLFSINQYENENDARGCVDKAVIDNAENDNSDTVAIVVVFEWTAEEEDEDEHGKQNWKRTSPVIIREGKHNKENPDVMAQGGNEQKVTALIVLVCVLGIVTTACALAMCAMIVHGKRQKKQGKGEQLFVKDVEMATTDSDSRERVGKIKGNSSKKTPQFYSNEDAKSTDALLGPSDDTARMCFPAQKGGDKEKEGRGKDEYDDKEDRKASEQVTSRTESQNQQSTTKQIQEEDQTKAIAIKPEPTPTTSSIDNLVEGMCCESPFEKVIVDTRDSLFERLHHSKDPRERTMDVRERVVRAARTLYWILNGIERILDEGKHIDLLKNLSSHSVMFGEEGVVCIGRAPTPKNQTGNTKATGRGASNEANTGKYQGAGPASQTAGKVGSDPKKEETDEASAEFNRWKAPDQLANDHASANEKSLVFSAGVLFYEMVTGDIPFDGVDGISAALKILSGERPSLATLKNKAITGLLTQCFIHSPTERPSISELKAELLQFLPEGSRELGRSDATKTNPTRREDGEEWGSNEEEKDDGEEEEDKNDCGEKRCQKKSLPKQQKAFRNAHKDQQHKKEFEFGPFPSPPKLRSKPAHLNVLQS